MLLGIVRSIKFLSFFFVCSHLWSLLLILKHYLHTIFPVVLIDLRFYKQYGFELYLFNIINPSLFPSRNLDSFCCYLSKISFINPTRITTKHFHVLCWYVLMLFLFTNEISESMIMTWYLLMLFAFLPKATW